MVENQITTRLEIVLLDVVIQEVLQADHQEGLHAVDSQNQDLVVGQEAVAQEVHQEARLKVVFQNQNLVRLEVLQNQNLVLVDEILENPVLQRIVQQDLEHHVQVHQKLERNFMKKDASF